MMKKPAIKLAIHQVHFGKMEGKEVVSPYVYGTQRLQLLQRARVGWILPDGMFLVRRMSTCSQLVRITRDEVDWATWSARSSFPESGIARALKIA